MRKKSVLTALTILVWVVWSVLPVEGIIIESPKNGDTIVVGELVTWRVRLGPNEECKNIIFPESDYSYKVMPAKFDSTTGLFEWTDVVKPEADDVGQHVFLVIGEPQFSCRRAKVTLNVVLPPTTVLTKISAGISAGKKQGFLTLYKHANGNLVQTFYGFNEVTVRGLYSDGMWRGITEHPDTTYTSSDEKVVKVTPPGKWMVNDQHPERSRRAEDERPWKAALVTAVGPGTADIIVRNGSHESSVTAIVNIKPCSEWKRTGASKRHLPICD